MDGKGVSFMSFVVLLNCRNPYVFAFPLEWHVQNVLGVSFFNLLRFLLSRCVLGFLLFEYSLLKVESFRVCYPILQVKGVVPLVNCQCKRLFGIWPYHLASPISSMKLGTFLGSYYHKNLVSCIADWTDTMDGLLERLLPSEYESSANINLGRSI